MFHVTMLLHLIIMMVSAYYIKKYIIFWTRLIIEMLNSLFGVHKKFIYIYIYIYIYILIGVKLLQKLLRMFLMAT
jgi:hypothetical protein